VLKTSSRHQQTPRDAIDVLFVAAPCQIERGTLRRSIIQGMRCCRINWVCVRGIRGAMQWLRHARNTCRVVLVEPDASQHRQQLAAELDCKQSATIQLIEIEILRKCADFSAEFVVHVLCRALDDKFDVGNLC
jgi:hypothetical protein